MEAHAEVEAQSARSAKPASGVVVLGATSSMVRAAAIELARMGYSIVAGARDAEENELVARDLAVRCGVRAWAIPFDAEDFAGHADFVQECRDRLDDSIEGVLLGVGWMDRQELAQSDFKIARRTIDVNYTASVSILELFARYFEETKAGRSRKARPFIAAISSVAGDRGRQSNYIYGSAKAALSSYLAGLRNRLFRSKVAVVTIKPGFVDTKMTFALDLKAAASPESAGKAIVRAIRKRKNVAYVPWFWRYIMVIVRGIPECVFKRLRM